MAAQTLPAIHSDPVDLTADKLIQDSNGLHGQGRVRVKLGALLIQADEAMHYSDTGELDLLGHVAASFPGRDDHILLRFGSGSIVTDQSLEVHADRITVENGRLEASGNVLVALLDRDAPKLTQLRSEELSMSLKTGDALLRGNIRTNIYEPANPFPGQPNFTKFPADIIK
jgi:lipopolysaccharide export system protein LptA